VSLGAGLRVSPRQGSNANPTDETLCRSNHLAKSDANTSWMPCRLASGNISFNTASVSE
jgi:hypothetical protein